MILKDYLKWSAIASYFKLAWASKTLPPGRIGLALSAPDMPYDASLNSP